ncbi:transmembrane reductase CYB561D2-like [Cloeon dipterum]|uniref:transmembrane reductase CYB561D2-like n=1 Tax=Cloeon dipterum TaxID=197152 RepID=UPI00321F789E
MVKTKGVSNKIFYFAAILLQSFCHGIAIAIPFVVCWYCFSDYSLFSFHPSFFSIGFLLLFTEGFLLFLPDNVLTKTLARQTTGKIHGALQALGFAFSVAGFVIIVVYKFNNNFQHIRSAHSITGLVAFILTCLAFCGGVATRLKVPHLARLKVGHNALGLVAYAVGISALCLGLLAKFPDYVGDGWVTCMVVLTAVTGATIVSNALFSLFKRVKNL